MLKTERLARWLGREAKKSRYLRLEAMNRTVWAACIIILAASCSMPSCKDADAGNAALSGRQAVRREDNPENFRAIDSAIRLLKSGDLALRTGADATSVMLRQMNLTDKTYSHCGIVLVENGYPYVYHSIGGEDNPEAKLRRDSAAVFFTPVSNERLGVARLDISGAQVGRLAGIARRYWRQGVLFDLDFDLKSDDKLYCAEFVYKAVREATADTGYFQITHLLKRSYVGVDNLCAPRHAKIICDVRYKL